MLTSELSDLERAVDEIWQVAQRFGLDPYPVHFEIVPPQIMHEFGAYGLPGRFSHWTHGRTYHQLKTVYDYGLSKIYELVVNANPCYAFLLESNSVIQNKLVIAHVLAHADFFRHNAYFRSTNRRMIETSSANAERIRSYEFEHGPTRVERYLDAALSIQEHVESSLFPRRQSPTPEPPPRHPQSSPTTPFDDLFTLDTPAPRPAAPVSRKLPPEPEADLLLFIMGNSPDLDEWQREILAIVRAESLYFRPQMQTKIANEGWASYWHSRILRELDLTDQEAVEFAGLHASVLAPARRSVNPYLVGLRLFEDIKRRWDAPTEEERKELGRRGGEGDANIFEVRTLEDDVSLVRNYLTADLVEELDLYLYQLDGGEWKMVDRNWERVRDHIAGELATLGHPHVVVEDGDYRRNRELYLRHSHDGRELDVTYAEHTLEHVYALWGRPVHIQTVRDGKDTVLSYDGERHLLAAV